MNAQTARSEIYSCLFVSETNSFLDVESIADRLITEIDKLDYWFGKKQTVEVEENSILTEVEVIKDEDNIYISNVYAMTKRLDALEDLEYLLKNLLLDWFDKTNSNR